MKGASLLQARCANILVDFTALALAEQLKNVPGLVILEHPEDLGKAGNDVPGSIWQFETIKELAKQPGVVTGALRQSDFGTTYQKPTRLLCRLPGIEDHTFVGWPRFEDGVQDLIPQPGPKSSATFWRS